MIVENVECNTGKSPALTGEELLAGKNIRVLVGEAVNRPMMANALPHGIRECREIDTPGKVTEDASDPCSRRVRSKEYMSQMVQTTSPVAWSQKLN